MKKLKSPRKISENKIDQNSSIEEEIKPDTTKGLETLLNEAIECN